MSKGVAGGVGGVIPNDTLVLVMGYSPPIRLRVDHDWGAWSRRLGVLSYNVHDISWNLLYIARCMF